MHSKSRGTGFEPSASDLVKRLDLILTCAILGLTTAQVSIKLHLVIASGFLYKMCNSLL